MLLMLMSVAKLSFPVRGGKAQLVHNKSIFCSQRRVFGAVLPAFTDLALGGCWAACGLVPNLACQMCGVMCDKNCHTQL